MNRTVTIVGLIFLWLAGFFSACNSEARLTQTSNDNAPSDNVPQAAPTITPQIDSAEPDGADDISGSSFPAGFAIQRDCDKAAPCLVNGEEFSSGILLSFISAEGDTTSSLHFPSTGSVVHIASQVDFGNPENSIIVFNNFEENRFEFIKEGGITREFVSSHIYSFLGVPGHEVFALSYLPGFTGFGGTDSGLSEIQVSPGMGAMVTSHSPSLLVVPIAINGNGKAPPENEVVEFWYTYEPYGIGGEILFPQYRGLYYVRGNQADHRELLSDDLQFSALAADGSVVAFTQPPNGALTLRDLRIYNETQIPLLPSTDRGAGFAIFSPNTELIAWMEASGSLADGDFESTIRVGSTKGEVLTDLRSDELADFGAVILPVGWLDHDRVLVQSTNGPNKGDSAVFVLNIDGYLEERSWDGNFIQLIN